MKSLLLPLLAALALPTGINAEITNLKDSYIQQEILKDEKLSNCTKLAKELQYIEPYKTFIYVDNSSKVWEIYFSALEPYKDNKFDCERYQVGVIGNEYAYSYRKRNLKFFDSHTENINTVNNLYTYENQKLFLYTKNDYFNDIQKKELKDFTCEFAVNQFSVPTIKELTIKNCIEFRSK